MTNGQEMFTGKLFRIKDIASGKRRHQENIF